MLGLLGGPLGLLLLFGFSLSFFYHLGNGIRHLFWDAGYGFDKHVARMSGWFTVIASVVFTAAFWMGIAA
jgi:succinate dehydrogenase / fumarate reductase cytochrome b subunit